MFKKIFFRQKYQNHLEQSENVTESPDDFNNIDRISEYFEEITGITFVKQKTILKSKLITFCKNNHISSFNECLNLIKSNEQYKQELINKLTTNETYFYREQHQLFELVNKIKNQQGKADILCAPCSTGEEVYSIIIMLLENNVSLDKFKITGIDINTQALEKSRQGIYNVRSISKVPGDILHKYFLKKNGKYHVINELKEHVDFKQDNVFSSSFKKNGKFDFILSRNLLIYFDKEKKLIVKDIFQKMLKNADGKVYYGHADLF